MKKIKFRGIAENGEQIFSNSIQFDEDGRGRKFCSLKDEFGNWIFIDPETVAQFVGYDADDNEVYEDDILVDARGVEWRIHDVPQVEMHIGGVYEGLYNEKFRLKGRGGNEKTDF